MKYKEEKIEPYVRMGYIILELALTQGAEKAIGTAGAEAPFKTQRIVQLRKKRGNRQPLETWGAVRSRETWGATRKLSSELAGENKEVNQN